MSCNPTLKKKIIWEQPSKIYTDWLGPSKHFFEKTLRSKCLISSGCLTTAHSAARKTEQRYIASSSFEECLCIPFLFVVSLNKDVPMGSRTQLTAWPLCACTPTSTARAQRSAEEKPAPALTTLHLTHLRNTPLSHRTKPPGHYHVTHGKATQKESLKRTGKRLQTHNCCVT